MTDEEKRLAKASLEDAFINAGGGSVSEGRKIIAERCGIAVQTTYKWSKVPSEHVLTVEGVSGVPRSYLRHDLYPGKGIVGEGL